MSADQEKPLSDQQDRFCRFLAQGMTATDAYKHAGYKAKNDNVAGVLGHVLSVLADRAVNVVDMVNKSRGELGINLIDVEAAIGEAVVAAIRAVPHVIRVRVLGPVEGR